MLSVVDTVVFIGYGKAVGGMLSVEFYTMVSLGTVRPMEVVSVGFDTVVSIWYGKAVRVVSVGCGMLVFLRSKYGSVLVRVAITVSIHKIQHSVQRCSIFVAVVRMNFFLFILFRMCFINISFGFYLSATRALFLCKFKKKIELKRTEKKRRTS